MKQKRSNSVNANLLYIYAKVKCKVANQSDVSIYLYLKD